MIKRLLAISFLFISLSVPWLVLTGLPASRTHSANSSVENGNRIEKAVDGASCIVSCGIPAISVPI